MFLILIETSANQRYIFSTNKLRENVGASELTYQIGTQIVENAVNSIDPRSFKFKEILNEPAIGTIVDGKKTQTEVIIATSGKALILVSDEPTAKKLVGFVTKKALIEMPGLTVHGAIVEVKDDLTNIHDAVGKVHRKLEEIRHQVPSNLQRFQRLPFVEPCATSGLPASEVYRHESLLKTNVELKPYSSLSIKKQEISNQGRKRLEQMVEIIELDVRLPGNINDLEKKFQDTKWLSIIHADGNGLGEIFLNFEEYSMPLDGRDYVKKYRKFSVALDICTINAAKKGLTELKKKYDEQSKNKLDDLIKKYKHKFSQSKKQKREGREQEAKKLYKQGREFLRKARDLKKLPFIPLILGGDDLTVICDGEYAIKFTHDFLTEFEKETKRIDIEGGIIPQIANEAFGVSQLGICAGIAIIKPHYPFHQAYGLAENLLKSAKLVKTKIQHEHSGKKDVSIPCSAMDFHVLYDSSGVELKQIREKLVVDDGKIYLYAKPYIVTESKYLEKANKKSWLENRTWEKLETRVCAMKAKDDDGKNKLPNSQLHHIRESLFRGQKETDSEINLFKHRYENRQDAKKDKGFGKLLCEKIVNNEKNEDIKEYSLFFDEKHKKDGKEIDGFTTHFLDALDIIELWKGFECAKTDDENGGAK